MRRVLTLVLVPALAFAGCLQLPEPAGEVDADLHPTTGGTMTGTESRKESVGVCGASLGINGDDRFCAERLITVKGKLAGFDSMDVALETFNGEIEITEAAAGEWGFVATLKARGSTAAEATSRLAEIDFSWSHEGAGGHFVEVSARHSGEANNLQAELSLEMPRAILLGIVAETSNGDVSFAGRASALSLSTSNGGVVAKGEAGQLRLETSNGDVDAQLTPLASARWSLDTSNGDVTLVVPEGAKYGYRIEGDTSNGEVEYGMRDGEKGPCPEGSEYYTPPCSHRTFETNGFSSRAIQVSVALRTSNGEVSADPK